MLNVLGLYASILSICPPISSPKRSDVHVFCKN